MTRRRPAICDACARLRQRVDPQVAGRYVPYCAAFPEGVPAEIYGGGFDHRHEHPGDGGIRFAPRPAAEGAMRAFELRRT
ncbi:hypothetical protein SAMN05444920_109227 [Nonomuraea solani]|uniref:Uncharacterized protein n=1 Tax=Nonomuraea solani TaxID=1144553 RepID=A0A1H6EFD7_9ACTN|nr:hypothetical protein [Nonomuraea solani]SEG95983.1 hypothetical protein SAMN05444920_109227 [Nonomuraea solani]